MQNLIYENARVVDPVQGIDQTMDIAVADGKFAPIQEAKNPRRIDLRGRVLCPGFVDVHVHLRDPGQTYKEDMATGTAAAFAGGFTSVLAMPNTLPVPDCAEVVEDVYRRAAAMPVRVFQSGAITKGRGGRELSDFAALKAAGVPALSDDGSSPQDALLMEEAMRRAAALDLPIIDHCENTSISKPGVMHEGCVSRELKVPGQPYKGEEDIVARDIALAARTGCRVHLQHLSSAGSVEMLRLARARGLQVSGEATPHHLLLTDEACRKYGTNAKMAPPLREECDRQALIRALADGVITVIATDHAPHTAEEKAAGWLKAPFGIVGIETAVSLCLTHLYHTGILTLPQLVALFTKGPRELLRLPIGSLKIGEPAAVTILDLDAEFDIDVTLFKSKGRNCPYNGWHCKGRPIVG